MLCPLKERAFETMLCYYIRAEVPTELADEWTTWMCQDHIPAVLATGCFERAELWQEMDSVPIATFHIVYYCPRLELFRRYEELYASQLRNEHAQRFHPHIRLQRQLLVLRWTATRPTEQT